MNHEDGKTTKNCKGTGFDVFFVVFLSSWWFLFFECNPYETRLAEGRILLGHPALALVQAFREGEQVLGPGGIAQPRDHAGHEVEVHGKHSLLVVLLGGEI